MFLIQCVLYLILCVGSFKDQVTLKNNLLDCSDSAVSRNTEAICQQHLAKTLHHSQLYSTYECITTRRLKSQGHTESHVSTIISHHDRDAANYEGELNIL